MDEGWTRWVLDQYGFEYARVAGDDIQAGRLRDKIDVLLLADDGGARSRAAAAAADAAVAGARAAAAAAARRRSAGRLLPSTPTA